MAKADTVRFHWDHFAVNPSDAPAAAPGFTSTPQTEPVYLPIITTLSNGSSQPSWLSDWARTSLCTVSDLQ